MSAEITNQRKTQGSRKELRSRNQKIAADTMEALSKCFYINSDGERVDLSALMDSATRDTVLYEGCSPGQMRKALETKIEVTSESTLKALIRLHREELETRDLDAKTRQEGGEVIHENQAESNTLGVKSERKKHSKRPHDLRNMDSDAMGQGSSYLPETDKIPQGKGDRHKESNPAADRCDATTDICVLNFASGRNPGGGFLRGALAQEESLARSSGLYPCLQTQRETYYLPNRISRSPYYSNNAIYSPKVPFFRTDEGEWLVKPLPASVVSCAAVNAGVVSKRSVPKSEAKDQEEVRKSNEKRMRLILRVAALHKHEILVLGAFGCGVFRNDPKQIAGMWAKLLMNREFKGRFRRVCFAVFDHTQERRVLNAFKVELE